MLFCFILLPFIKQMSFEINDNLWWFKFIYGRCFIYSWRRWVFLIILLSLRFARNIWTNRRYTCRGFCWSYIGILLLFMLLNLRLTISLFCTHFLWILPFVHIRISIILIIMWINLIIQILIILFFIYRRIIRLRRSFLRYLLLLKTIITSICDRLD